MGNSHDRQVLEKAWELFISGDTHGLEKVSPTIRDSWLRSKALGVDPSLTHLPQIIPPERLEDFLCHNDLFTAGQQVIRSLLAVLADPAVVVGLCDSAGRLLDAAVGSRLKDWCVELNGVPGCGVGEEHIGTDNGTALYIKRPIQIRPGEHYCSFWQDWVTNVAPVHNPFTREIVGALSVEWLGERMHANVFKLLRWGRQILEHQLHSQQLLDRLSLLEQFYRYSLRFSSDALLAIDRQGSIVAANPQVATFLGQPPNAFLGCSAASILGCTSTDRWTEPLDDLASGLSYAHTALSAEILPVNRHGRKAGGVLVLHGTHRPAKSKTQGTPWQARYTFSDLIGQNRRFQKALDAAQAAAVTELSILLLGESGTGKELLAQAIHTASPRARGPFVPFNCGGVPEELVAAELFGYVDGAFTGAARGGQTGKVETAHGGTLVLDEVDEMPAKMQVSLLRVLEDGIVVPVGSTQPRQVDVRVIAVTNKNLRQMVTQGTFRADLYYRLSGLAISLPPLRERPEDIPLLAHHFLKQSGLVATLAPESATVLQSYAWPGNIRELKNSVLRAGTLATNTVIMPSDLFSELINDSQRGGSQAFLTLDPLAQAEKLCLTEALAKAQGNLAEAAASLGIHRVTLYRKMRRYGISQRSRGR